MNPSDNPFQIVQPKTEKDPVCGMDVDVANPAGRHEHEGKTYYFCSQHCALKFQADPERYLSGEARPEAMPDAEYTCPMHPEVVQVGFGSCPLCGMALEPKEVSLDTDDSNPELEDMSRRLWISLVFTVPLLVVTMSEMIPGFPLNGLVSARWFNWVQLALAAPVVLWCGQPFFERGWASIVHRSPNMFTLIAIGTGAAFLYSLLATLAPGILPEAFSAQRKGGSVLRSGSGDHLAGVVRTGAGASGPRANVKCDQGAARTGAEYGPESYAGR